MDSIDSHLLQANNRLLAANSYYDAGRWAEAAIHMSYAKLEYNAAYQLDSKATGLLAVQESYQTLYGQLIQKKGVTVEPLFRKD
jgi:hypothetical protein